jgi:hypothetical protein
VDITGALLATCAGDGSDSRLTLRLITCLSSNADMSMAGLLLRLLLPLRLLLLAVTLLVALPKAVLPVVLPLALPAVATEAAAALLPRLATSEAALLPTACLLVDVMPSASDASLLASSMDARPILWSALRARRLTLCLTRSVDSLNFWAPSANFSAAASSTPPSS